MKISKAILLLSSLLAGAILLFAWWSVGTTLPRLSSFPVEEPGPQTANFSFPSFTVATYNIAHGQGQKLEATDWRNKSFTEKQLALLAASLKKMNADVVFLQEVDLYAKRTHYINEALYLKEQAGYPYYACAVVWDKNYLPFPFTSLEFQLGRIKSANCILSKIPLGNTQERLVFNKPESNPFWYNLGYIDRAAQQVQLHLGIHTINIINIHLEAFDPECREKQMQDLLSYLKTVPGPIVLAGDFNALPPEASKKSGFIDEVVDFNTDSTIKIFRQAFPLATEAIPKEQYRQNESQSVTFPANAPSRRLDYLFGLEGAQVTEGRVFHEAGTASDHLPILGRITIQKKMF